MTAISHGSLGLQRDIRALQCFAEARIVRADLRYADARSPFRHAFGVFAARSVNLVRAGLRIRCARRRNDRDKLVAAEPPNSPPSDATSAPASRASSISTLSPAR